MPDWPGNILGARLRCPRRSAGLSRARTRSGVKVVPAGRREEEAYEVTSFLSWSLFSHCSSNLLYLSVVSTYFDRLIVRLGPISANDHGRLTETADCAQLFLRFPRRPLFAEKKAKAGVRAKVTCASSLQNGRHSSYVRGHVHEARHHVYVVLHLQGACRPSVTLSLIFVSRLN